MVSFYKRASEVPIQAIGIAIAMLLSFAIASVYFAQPGEIDPKVYWFVLFHVPTFVGVILIIIRPMIILNTENRNKSLAIRQTIHVLLEKQLIRSEVTGYFSTIKNPVTEAQIGAIQSYHWTLSILSIFACACSIISMIVRAIYYGSFSVDTSTLESTRASVIWIIVDPMIGIGWALIAIIVFVNSHRYHDQKKSEYCETAKQSINNLIQTWPTVVISGVSETAIQRESKIQTDLMINAWNSTWSTKESQQAGKIKKKKGGQDYKYNAGV